MELALSILYRGPLSSCNYNCHYCPFGKHHETAAELAVDRVALERFVSWCCDQSRELSILFTPWGEGLTRRWYREAIQKLSHQANVAKVAIQTNLSCKLDWLHECDLSRVGLWCTYHPSQVDMSSFISQCKQLDEMNAIYSVGIVGLKENWDVAQQLREALGPHVYVWVNAFKDVEHYYQPADVENWTSLDPLFGINNTRHPSYGKACRTGHTVISVDGDGTVRRCHFVKTPLGNLYTDSLANILYERPCSNSTCGCHIGFVHMPELKLYEFFGKGVLERVLPTVPSHQATPT